MKRILSMISVAGMIVISCNTSPKTADTTKVVSTPDTVGYAQFQQWKAQNELAATNQNLNEQNSQPTKTIVKYVPAKNSGSNRNTGSSNNGNMNSSSSNTAQAPEKKGISKAAKGAVIGGVAGAGAGAVINKKNRAVGAVVGGVLGAGAGYGIGRSKDKKDGRY